MQRRRVIRAVYDDLAHGRRAMIALQRAGIDAMNISLAGRPIDCAEANLDKRAEEGRATGYVLRRVLAGAAIGAVIGAVMALAGSIVYNAIGGRELLTNGTAVAVAVGALGLSAAGGVFGGIAGMGLGSQWELTFDDERGDGDVVLEINVEGEGARTKINEVLRATGPSRVDEE
jgi:hypothetical protein